MTVGAGDGPGLEAARERERLRAVEAVGPPVGPELPLRVELGQRLAYQERDGVVLVAFAGAEPGEDVALVAVTVGAGVEGAPRRGGARRKDLEQVAQAAIRSPRAVGGNRGGVALPALGQRDVSPARAVTSFAADTEFGPAGAVGVGGGAEPTIQVGGVAVEAVHVPELLDVVRAVGNRRRLLPVEPAPGLDVPEHRQHVDAPVGQRRQIALEALRAEGVVDLIGLGGAALAAHGDKRLALRGAEHIRAAVGAHPRVAAEVAEDRGLVDGPGHLDVERRLPARVGVGMARLAGGGADVVAVRGRRGGDGQGGRRRRRLGRGASRAARHEPRRGRQQRCRDEQQPGAGAHRRRE